MINNKIINIDIGSQTLDLIDDQIIAASYEVSTSKYGTGQQEGSYKTPLGMHAIKAKIGASCPSDAIFKGRRWVGRTYSNHEPSEDPIMARILWLSGLEVGYNRLGDVDTMQRYIYIHGTPSINMGNGPSSIGCIRMHAEDIITLFDLVDVGTRVAIHDHGTT
jgi:lipoprotein-anchoring transpeptidase ErfK/SrfK